ncbi:MAG: hypothetical protein JXA44_10780 [Methanospirillaceae archaeon]|nr:hypothetical protein [Methanospirillaceae archaeon]
MRMISLFLIVATLLAGPVVTLADEGTGEVPDLVGEWKAVYLETDSKDIGYEVNETPIRTVYIEKQSGRIFEGYKDYVWTEGTLSRRLQEKFLGIIAGDNKTLYLNDYSSGIAFGEITGPGMITVYYLHSFTMTGKKDPAVAVADYVRVS